MTTAISSASTPAFSTTPALPALREDLQLLSAEPQDDGAPCWTIYDPVRRKYFRIGWLEFEILNRWKHRDGEKIIEKVNRETTLSIAAHHLENLCRFLSSNNLIVTEDYNTLYQHSLTAKSPSLLNRLLKSYLFFRVPLWQPDNFLTATAPLTRVFFTPIFWSTIVMLGLMGLYLTMRQWDSFQQTFLYFFSTEGMLYYAAALTMAKGFHELGHAYTAKRFGLRVPTMGVAFILFWPMLYTDTTDAWRLASQRKRLLIGCAGVMVELIIAVTATFLWHFLPPGPLKGAAFLLATTTWLITLSINLNPFMRFDGYYILSDLLEVANLQSRSFTLGKWRLRKAILGLKTPCPESLTKGKRNILIAYSYGTWLYRFFLLLALSLIVYHFVFKLLGIFLLATQITMFITLPIFRELKEWWNMRRSIVPNIHIFSSLFIMLVLIFLAIFPWPTIVKIPALFKSAAHATVYPDEHGKIAEFFVRDNDTVEQGEPLFRIFSPHLKFLSEQCRSEVDILKMKLKKINFSRSDIDQLTVVQTQLTEKLTALEGYQEELDQLTVRAPIAGRIIFEQQEQHSDRWVNKNTAILTIVNDSHMVVEGFVHEQNYAAIKDINIGKFYPESLQDNPFAVQLSSISLVDMGKLKSPYLASIYGGDIPVSVSMSGQLTLQSGYYKIIMQPLSRPSQKINHIMRGSVRVVGESKNLLQRAWPQISSVLIRESGF